MVSSQGMMMRNSESCDASTLQHMATPRYPRPFIALFFFIVINPSSHWMVSSQGMMMRNSESCDASTLQHNTAANSLLCLTVK